MYLIDTDVISEARKGEKANPGVRQFFDDADRDNVPMFLSAITVSELRFGAANGEFRKENEAALEDLLDLFELEDLPCGAATDFAQIKVALQSKGKLTGPYDMLIASHARHISATVVTNNEREFRRVPGLSVENWLKP